MKHSSPVFSKKKKKGSPGVAFAGGGCTPLCAAVVARAGNDLSE